MHRGRVYHPCTGCGSVFMERKDHLSLEAERARYEKHSDDIYDPGYRRYVLPIVEAVLSEMPPGGKGLDFGSGRGAIVSTMLGEKGFSLERYDPFFFPDPVVLEGRYDYIACCEVVEHFRDPRKEFEMLRGLLNDGGKLFIMTLIMGSFADFSSWYYKDDETHVFFYSKQSFAWIRSNLGFGDLKIDGRVIVLRS
jgi:hypothetical protein